MKINWIFFAGSLALFSTSVLDARAASAGVQKQANMQIARNERKTVKRDVRNEHRPDHRQNDRQASHNTQNHSTQNHSTQKNQPQHHRPEPKDVKQVQREQRLHDRQVHRDLDNGKHNDRHAHSQLHSEHQAVHRDHQWDNSHRNDRWVKQYYGHKKYRPTYWTTGHHHTKYCGHGYHFDHDFAYLASGLILGGIINQTFFNDGYSYYGSNRWGECFKVSIHGGRESYTQVPDYMCY